MGQEMNCPLYIGEEGKTNDTEYQKMTIILKISGMSDSSHGVIVIRNLFLS